MLKNTALKHKFVNMALNDGDSKWVIQQIGDGTIFNNFESYDSRMYYSVWLEMIFEAAGAVLKIGSCLNPNRQNSIWPG